MMRYRTLLTSAALAAVIAATGCNNESDAGPDAAAESAEKAAREQRERSEEAAELERRASNLESQWKEMQTKVQTRGRTATAGLREEIQEDVKNAQTAVADLKTTTEDNWWDRHERVLERAVRDVQADVQRLTKQKAVTEPAEQAAPVGASLAFAERRDAFVGRLRARVDAMEEQLKGVKADGALNTELEDTRARIDTLQADLDELRNASPDNWWDLSSERVSDYIGRVEESINRLDDNKAAKD
jgi:DNA repair exonuclease SbcCD ATPase subunit